jgi:hypothetical protein
LESDGAVLDFDSLSDDSLHNINIIDMSGSNQEIENLDVSDVLNMTGDDNTLTILGDEGDSVSLGDGWAKGDAVTDENGNTFNTYAPVGDVDDQLNQIQILIDTNIHVDQ